jgi:hypothetical protein
MVAAVTAATIVAAVVIFPLEDLMLFQVDVNRFLLR